MRDRTGRRWLLAITLLGSLAASLLVSWWLLGQPATSTVEAVKTGGLAGGAILALYALWINDRRRRTEEGRHEVERSRAELDRERVADERFAKAVELLGHEADQVRVGAMHVLAGLARTRPDYTQTVLDVLCSYLRRPFDHPAFRSAPGNPDQVGTPPVDPPSVDPPSADPPSAEVPADGLAAADRERQVRLTAQRLIGELLPRADSADAPRYDIDLTAAALEYVDLTGRQVGSLVARRAQLYGITRLRGFRANGMVLFTGAVFHGRADLSGAEFRGGLSLFEARVAGEWRVEGATVGAFANLRAPAPPQQVGELAVAEGTRLSMADGDGWAVRKPS